MAPSLRFRRISSWTGLSLLAAGSSLLLFPALPALDAAGRAPRGAPFAWPWTWGAMALGAIFLAWGRGGG